MKKVLFITEQQYTYLGLKSSGERIWCATFSAPELNNVFQSNGALTVFSLQTARFCEVMNLRRQGHMQ
jgi:hypothetical protein